MSTPGSSKRPSVYVYRYSTILSYIMERFIDDNAEYIQHSHGKYHIFAKVYTTKFLINSFIDYIDEFFRREDLFPTGENFTIVVGTCYCHHSWRADFQHEMESNNKLRIIKNKIPIRYAFADRNFSCDEEQLNLMFDTLLSQYIKGDKKVFTSNWTDVRWTFIKNIPEDDMVKVITRRHHNAKMYPLRKSNLIMDLNNMVYKEQKKKHYFPAKIRDQAIYIYNHITNWEGINGKEN